MPGRAATTFMRPEIGMVKNDWHSGESLSQTADEIGIGIAGCAMASNRTTQVCSDFKIRIKLIVVGSIIVDRRMQFKADTAGSEPRTDLV